MSTMDLGQMPAHYGLLHIKPKCPMLPIPMMELFSLQSLTSFAPSTPMRLAMLIHPGVTHTIQKLATLAQRESTPSLFPLPKKFSSLAICTITECTQEDAKVPTQAHLSVSSKEQAQSALQGSQTH